MFSWFWKLVATILGIYVIFPTILARICHVGVIWRTSPGRGRVALTFDDGPDPVYTPRVLEVLREHGVRACFFVLGEKAGRYPSLVDRLQAEGHEVASHGYSHVPQWFMGPGGTYREVEKTARIIEEVTGRRPRFFRPPWGVVNAFTLWPRYLFGQRVVLWSFMSLDWWHFLSAEQIARLVLRRARDGSILLFHDSNTDFGSAPGAAAKMLEALPLILNGLREKGLRVASMDEILDNKLPPLPLRVVRSLWAVWERVFEKLAHVADPGGPDCLFRLAVHKYGGTPRTLPDGTSLKRGDLVAELHLKNEHIQALTAGTPVERSAAVLAREALKSMPRLAEVLENHPGYRDVKALVGYTMLHRSVHRIGFSVFELPRGIRAAIALYEWWLMILYHRNGWSHVRRYWRKLIPKLVIISREEFLARQKPRASRRGRDVMTRGFSAEC